MVASGIGTRTSADASPCARTIVSPASQTWSGPFTLFMRTACLRSGESISSAVPSKAISTRSRRISSGDTADGSVPVARKRMGTCSRQYACGSAGNAPRAKRTCAFIASCGAAATSRPPSSIRPVDQSYSAVSRSRAAS